MVGKVSKDVTPFFLIANSFISASLLDQLLIRSINDQWIYVFSTSWSSREADIKLFAMRKNGVTSFETFPTIQNLTRLRAML
jgi:hypothetical protein